MSLLFCHVLASFSGVSYKCLLCFCCLRHKKWSCWVKWKLTAIPNFLLTIYIFSFYFNIKKFGFKITRSVHRVESNSCICPMYLFYDVCISICICCLAAVTYCTVFTKVNIISGNSFCWTCCWNLSLKTTLRATKHFGLTVLIKWCW